MLVRAGLSAGDLDRAHRLAERAWRSRPRHIQLQDLLIASLDLREEADRALALSVENAARRLRWLARRRVTGPRPRRLGPAERIFIAGFFKSGSSAVLDYLRGVPGSRRWTPTGEMRLLKAPGGVAELIGRRQASGALSDLDLVDFYLHLTGWKLTRHPPGTFHPRDVVNRHGEVLFRSPRAFGYLQVCLEAFLELVELTRSAQPTVGELEDFFRGAVSRALDAAAADTGASVLLIDQAVNAWRLPLSRLVPPSTFVIVHRDPRDQFVDAQRVHQKPGLPALVADSFAGDYRQRRAWANRDAAVITRKYGHRSVRLSFEDFVLDHHRQARNLLAALGLPPPRRWADHYRPSLARDAIGRHRRLVSPADLVALTVALPEFLDHRVGSPAGSGTGSPAWRSRNV
jgi:hypothetical protein